MWLLILILLGYLFVREGGWRMIPARHRAYGRYVLRHKWFVLLECARLDLPLWRALIHDWDKFLPDEWFAYAKTFWTEDGEAQYAPSDAFTRAWNLHQKRNKHHWQFWLITWDHGGTEALPMPDVFRREMLADWRGAGRALGKPDTLAWYTANRDKMILHDETRQWIDDQLGYKGGFVEPHPVQQIDRADLVADVSGKQG